MIKSIKLNKRVFDKKKRKKIFNAQVYIFPTLDSKKHKNNENKQKGNGRYGEKHSH